MLLTFAPRRTCPSGQDHRHTSSGDVGGIQSKLDPFLFLELSMSLGTNTCHCVLFCGDVIGTRTLLKPGQAHPDIRSVVCVSGAGGWGRGGGGGALEFRGQALENQPLHVSTCVHHVVSKSELLGWRDGSLGVSWQV